MADSPVEVGSEIAAAMARTSKALRGAVRSSMADAGKAARTTVEKSGRPFTGGDLRFSNMRGARIGVRTKPLPDGVLVAPRGPWGLLQPGRRPGPGRHPGTRNTRAWDRGRDAAFDAVGVEVIRRVGGDVERAL